MAITFRSESSGVGTAAGITLNKPAGVVANDVLWAHVSTDGTAVTAPTGWVQQATGSSPSAVATSRAFTRVVDGGVNDGATYTFTSTGATGTEGLIGAYIGVDNTTPMDAAATVATGTAATITFPNITTATDNAWHLASAFDNVGPAPPAPATYTGRSLTAGTRVSDKNITPAGLVTGVTTTGGSDWVAISGALRSAVTLVAQLGDRIYVMP